MTRPASPRVPTCAAPGCDAPAPFGYGPPGWPDRFHVCPAHRAWAGGGRSAAPAPGDADRTQARSPVQPDLFGPGEPS